MQILNPANIDVASNAVSEFLTKGGAAPKDVLRTRLTVEEILLKYFNQLGEDSSFAVVFSKRFHTLRVELQIAGESIDFFSDDDIYGILSNLLSGYGLLPVWRYRKGRNLIVFTVKKKHKVSQVLQMLVSIAAAVVFGLLLKAMPAGLSAFIIEDLITPISNTFMGILSAIAGPIVFFSVLWGICGIGDIATFGKMGKKIISRFLVGSLIIGIVGTMVCIPFFKTSSSGTASFAFTDLYQMILDIVPKNFISPFAEGNSMQIVFMAFVVGITMLFLGSQVSNVTGFIGQANIIVQTIMRAVSAFIPFFVFSSVLGIVVGDNVNLIIKSYKLILVMAVEGVLLMGVYVMLICIRKRVSPIVLLKKMLPTFIIGLTTASSVAAFQTNVTACKTQLGVEKKLVDVGVPLGQVIFMPGALISYLCAAFCMGEAFGIAMNPMWILTLTIISVILSIAAPPIPGAALTCYTVLFMQLNLPTEAVAVVIALNVILEFAATGLNLFCLQSELVEIAGELDILDEDCLRR